MKKTDGLHPDYHAITVVMTNGTEFTTYSTYGKEGDKLALDIDPSTHPAWTGGNQQLLDRLHITRSATVVLKQRVPRFGGRRRAKVCVDVSAAKAED